MLIVPSESGEITPETIAKLPYYEAYGRKMPLYWGDEQSGRLREAVMAYLTHTQTSMMQDDFALVRAYCRYVIRAGCWDANPHSSQGDREKLEALRARIEKVATAEELTRWIHQCLDLGIDPL